MRIYALTELGKKFVKNHSGNSEQMKVLHYLKENKTATDDEIEVRCGGSWVLRRLRAKGLITELTT